MCIVSMYKPPTGVLGRESELDFNWFAGTCVHNIYYFYSELYDVGSQFPHISWPTQV